MSRELDQEAFKENLNEIRGRLMAAPGLEELQTMQLQMEVLQRWAQLARAADEPYHNHDHQNTDHNDHDHAIIFEGAVER